MKKGGAPDSRICDVQNLILGHHLILELYGIDGSMLSSQEQIERVMGEVIQESGLHSLGSKYHKFPEGGSGISGVEILQESHVTIHTWPEYNYASVDVYACDLSIILLLSSVHMFN